MRYLFDPVKRRANLRKHGLDLEAARSVIESGSTLTFEDHRFAYDDERYVTLGLYQDTVVVVVIVTAESVNDIRVISMRKADRYEQKIYFENR